MVSSKVIARGKLLALLSIAFDGARKPVAALDGLRRLRCRRGSDARVVVVLTLGEL
jgi:hypothetical protein